MRKITTPQIAVFFACFSTAIVLGIGSAVLVFDRSIFGAFRPLWVTFGSVGLIYFFSLIVYRLFLRLSPLVEGDLLPGSTGEFSFQVNTLFYLLIFNSLIKTHFLPIPVVRLVYLMLGARIGADSYGGILLEPPLTTIGRNCILGHDALLFCHVIEGDRLALAGIRIGDRVTVGANAIIMPGARIDDDAIVSAAALVTKGTHIPAGETWGGVPARRLRQRTEDR